MTVGYSGTPLSQKLGIKEGSRLLAVEEQAIADDALVENLAAYKKMAMGGKKAWMKYGALEYYECVGDVLDSPWGLPFSKLLKLKKDETAIFAFVVYKSKADRNRITKLVQTDPAMNDPKWIAKMPFDMKTMTTGMFKVIVST